jgi:hypothetical protein
MSEPAPARRDERQPASRRLRYGICDCEYPCSCCEFDGERYGSWKEVIDALGAEVERLREALVEAVEFADEGWAYASSYFREKWDYDKRRALFAALLAGPPRTTSKLDPSRSKELEQP